MAIKITALGIKKDCENLLPQELGGINRLKGSLKLSINDGKFINTTQRLEIENISTELQDELYAILNKIEDELNGVVVDSNKYSWDSTKESEVVKALNNHREEFIDKLIKIDTEGNVTFKGDITYGIIKGEKLALATVSPEEVILPPEDAKKLLKTPQPIKEVLDNININITISNNDLKNDAEFANKIAQMLKTKFGGKFL